MPIQNEDLPPVPEGDEELQPVEEGDGSVWSVSMMEMTPILMKVDKMKNFFPIHLRAEAGQSQWLFWIARQGRLDLGYRVWHLQNSVKNATIATLTDASRCVA